MKTPRFTRHTLIASLAAAAVLLTACESMTPEQKGTAAGAGIGAATGAVISAATGGKAGVGAAVGGVVGAGAGALGSSLTEPEDVNLGDPPWRNPEARPQLD